MKKENVDLRDLFIGIEELIPSFEGGYIKPINFDNGATTPAFKMVLKYIHEFMPLYAAVGRSEGYKSRYSTEFYENSRNVVLDFLNISNKNSYDVIYVKNTTEGINLLSNILINKKDDIVITTRMEHHSNDLPWRKQATVKYAGILKNGRVNVNDIENLFDIYGDKVKLLAITGASNVTGFVNDIHYLSKIAHKHNAYIIVDGAQLVPHKEVFMEGKETQDYIDFLVFSSHKMYSPFGIGAIVGRKDILEKSRPDYVGGGQIKFVSDYHVVYKDSPTCYEAGTQNLMGVVALIAAIKQIKKVTFPVLESVEKKLLYRVLSGLNNIKRIELYGEITTRDKLGMIVFNLKGVHHEKVGEFLAKEGISVRTGCFCAQPYAKRILGVSDEREHYQLTHPDEIKDGMVRVSLGLYNNESEVDRLLDIIEFMSKYIY